MTGFAEKDPESLRDQRVNHPEDHDGIDRRQFLKRVGKAGVAMAGVGLLSYRLYDPHGPSAGQEYGRGQVTLPSFAQAGKKPQMAIAHGADRVQSLNLKPLEATETC